MTYVVDLPRGRNGFGGLVAQLRRGLGFGLRPEPAATPAPLPYGPAPEALVDADIERMAGFGSWAELRRDLRARAAGGSTPATP